MALNLRCLTLTFVALALLASVTSANAVTEYKFIVGAFDDYASKGSNGVQAEIQTNTYHIHTPDIEDHFFVTAKLENNDTIFFGYMQPASDYTYCTEGQITTGGQLCFGVFKNLVSQAHWSMEYMHDEQNYYYKIESATYSVSGNGTWHSYAVVPNSEKGWSFILDGKQVATYSDQQSMSVSYAFVEAEKSSESEAPSGLGPVQFGNFGYLTNDGWRKVTSLTASIRCAVAGEEAPCQSSFPFGISVRA